ncbi:MAG: Peptidyl-prolyl cis-trans isomerase [uncultured bacterium]|nr:MAG: Peptidyl-prolyl cis-trans isomerase [uncultured bacterium]
MMKRISIFLAALMLFSGGIYAAENSSASTTTIQTQTPEVKNKMQGEVFLAANKKKTGVITLSDGLQYKVIVQGKGQKPTLTDRVTVHYAGTLIDGTEFDSSYKRGEPAIFMVGQVIPGWVEALQLMPVGSTWELYIPANLGYGEQGAPPSIGPNETLIFKVQLLDVKKS